MKLSIFRVILGVCGATVVAFALSACHGGGGASVTVDAVNLNPNAPAAGSLVQATGQFTGNGSAGATKSWSVTAGSLSLTPPDFALLLRQTAKNASATSLTTTQDSVYWLAPAAGGQATITLAVGSSSKTRTVTFSASPVSLSVTDTGGGGKQVSVIASNVTDLYQAAFRVTYSSSWKPTSASAGDFLGTPSDVLFFGLTNQPSFVPIAITRKGSAAGVTGSGALATIVFAPNNGASSVRGESALEPQFDLSLIVLRDSHDQPIQF